MAGRTFAHFETVILVASVLPHGPMSRNSYVDDNSCLISE
jgi:hypothetical protein